MMNKKKLFDYLKGGLIVSCQALEHEPLHSSYIMSRMAYAAMLGGARGIRSNSVEDIVAIKDIVDLPVIGIIKKTYEGSDVYITPTEKEVDLLIGCGTDIIAIDATSRMRPDGMTILDAFPIVRQKYPNAIFMADCSNFEEGIAAAKLGFDCVGTTMSSYTHYTKERILPDYDLMERLVENLDIPVIAEGGIWQPDQLVKAMGTGVLTSVVGTAITRPMDITQRFVNAIK